MRPGLQLKLGNQLAITPQLQQAIRLLQLSQMELRQDIQLVLESNPLLEYQEEGDEATEETSSEPQVDAPDEDAELDLNEDRFDDSFEDSFGGDVESAGSGGSGEAFDGTDTQAASESLQDHLMWQLNLTPMSPQDRAIAGYLIESINSDGFLLEPLEALNHQLNDAIAASPEEIQAVLRLIQRFDPVGVGSRNLSECLAVQLSVMDPDDETVALAVKIVAEHLEALARGDVDRLLRRFKVTQQMLDDTIALIRTLDPRPGARFSDLSSDYVIPDVYVSKRQGKWHVSLNASALPKIKINGYYQSLISAASKSDASYMRGHLQEARWFLRSLEARHDTLKRVASAIVERQRSFFESGAQSMQPMVLRDIAERVELHESTVSRVTARKYMHTPRGVFEFKYFFSSHVSTSDGGECSAVAIHSMLKELIGAESPRKPLSDAQLADILNTKGIDVARRTVAKYREGMGIASSSERKRLA